MLAMLIFAIIVIGIGLFYQQQLTNAAREAARFAAVNSATAQCPTVSHLDPQAPPTSYSRCDRPPNWPRMVAHARSRVWAINRDAVHFSACWSGYVSTTTGAHDAGPYDPPPTPGASPVPNTFRQCTIGGRNPLEETELIACPPPATVASDDKASSLAITGSAGQYTNRVTLYGCYNWQPPLAGFLLIPSTITLRAVVGEVVHPQQ